MLTTPRFRTQIALLLVMTLLLQPVTALPVPEWLPRSGISQVALAAPLEQTPAGSNNVYLPLISTSPGTNAPDFVINSPTSKKISGVVYFSIQPLNDAQINTVVFRVGAAAPITDTTPANGFKIFLNTTGFPGGSTTMSATANGPNGSTTKTLAVEIVKDPPASTVVDQDGAIVASEIGSVVAIPPGGAAPGTTITVDERTQQEVTNDTNFDWENMGVTFLGAQQIDTSQPFTSALMVSSAGFGNRVQPGQAVVNYMLQPDVDGDGVGELIVINSASVAPNGDVISDPVEQVSLRVPANGFSGVPGKIIEFTGTGFNSVAAFGTVAIFQSQVTSQVIQASAIVNQISISPTTQSVMTAIPLLPTGKATLVLQNLTTGVKSAPINLQIEAPAALSQPASQVIDDFFAASITFLQTLPPSSPAVAQDIAYMIAQQQAQQARFQAISSESDAQVQQFLKNYAASLEGSGMLQSLARWQAVSNQSATACISPEKKQQLEQLALTTLMSGLSACAVAAAIPIPVAGAVIAAICLATNAVAYALAKQKINSRAVCKEEEEEKKETCKPPPNQQVNNNRVITGMGSAPPTGGPVCGNAPPPPPPPPRRPPFQFPLAAQIDSENLNMTPLANNASEGTTYIKIYSANRRLRPFTGIVGEDGYFFIPLLPEDERFTVVAVNSATGNVAKRSGIGVADDQSILTFLDLSPKELNVVRWDGMGDGESWEDPFNWDSFRVPGPGDHVIIDVPGHITVTHSLSETVIKSLYSAESFQFAGGSFVVTSSMLISENLIVASDLVISHSLTISKTLIINGGKLELRTGRDLTLPNLTISGGELNDSSALTVSGILSWTGGMMSGSGRTVSLGTLGLDSANPKILSGRRLDNAGTATWRAGDFYIGEDALFTNRAGATFNDLLTTANNLWFQQSTGRFVNAGTYTKSGASISNAYIIFDNTGTVNIQNGNLWLSGTGVNSATVNVANGASLLFASDYTFAGISHLNGAGRIEFSAGTVTIPSTSYGLTGNMHMIGGKAVFDGSKGLTLPNLTISGGELSGSSALTVTGVLSWTGGMMSGSGRTVSLGTLGLDGANPKVLSGRRLDNAGTITWRAGDFYIGEDALFTNRAGATFNDLLTTDNNLWFQQSAGRFVNAGTYTKSGASISNAYITFDNTGTVNVQNGNLWLSGTGVNSATVNVANGASLLFASDYTFAGISHLNGAGRIEFSAGTVTIPSASYGLTGNMHMSGGKAVFDGSKGLTLPNLTISGGELSGSSALTVTGILSWTGGMMSGSGRTVSLGTLGLDGANPKVLSGRRLDNAGTITWRAGDFYIGEEALFTNRTGATFNDLLITDNNLWFQQSTGRFVNAGTYTKSGASISNAYIIFDNTGTINVQNGNLWLSGTGVNSATVNVANGASLLFASDYTFAGISHLNGAGRIEFNAGTVTIPSTSYGLTGNMHMIGGKAVFDGSKGLTLPNLTISGGELNGSSALTVSGILSWTGGMMSGSGRTVSLGTLGLDGANPKVLSGRRLDNAGTTTWRAGDFYIGEDALFTNRTGATFNDLLTTDNNLWFQQSAGRFVNAGTYTKSGASISNAFIVFDNTGTVNVQNGKLQLSGTGVNSATMTISAGVTLDIDNAYENAASGVINGNGTLDLQNATFTNNGTIAPTVTVIN